MEMQSRGPSWTRRTGGVGVVLTSAAVLAVIAAGCPRSSNQHQTGPGPATGGPDAGVAAVPLDGGGDSGLGEVVPVVPAPTCAAIPCVYYPGTDTNYDCLSSGAGRCFHYGGPCVPDGACMFDRTRKSYRKCAQPSEGRCLRFGDPCQPLGECWFAPDDTLYRTCQEPAGGSCRRYGATCDPV